MTIADRFRQARRTLPPVEPRYVIVYEDGVDEPVHVVVPDQRWLAMALAGGYLPPVEAFDALEHDAEGRCLNLHVLETAPPLGPMTEEEAMEYLVRKDVPRRVWDAPPGNRPRLAITLRANLPANRAFRNAWTLNMESSHD